MWPFGRKKSDDMRVETLLDEANAASPTGDATFRMPVEDVFTISGRGTVVTGRIESGTVRVGMPVRVVRAGAVAATTTVTGVEMFRKVLDTATTGDNVGLLLDRLTKQEVLQGDVLEG
jgi:elongation factor Tu